MKHFVPLCGLALSTLPALGQTALSNQGAVISIQSGAQVAVVGDISIGTGGTIDNAGTLTFTGNWDNSAGSGVLTPGTGTVLLLGTAQQQLGGSSATTFHSLDVSGATGPVQLTANASVGNNAGTLTLGTKQLQLNAKVLTLNNGATTAISSSTGQLVSETTPTAGYGRFVWVIGAGTGTYVVPLGTGTTRLPVTFDISTAGAGAAGSLDVATYPTPPSNQPLPTGISALQGDPNKTLDRYWITQASNYTILPTATLSFTYQESEWNTSPNAILETNLRLQQRNGTVWSASQGSVNTGVNTLTSNAQNGFGVFAATDLTAPLPVELSEFSAQARGSDGVLDWVTASERNNQGFDVEASLDGTAFQKIGFVAGYGSSTTPHSYRYTDANAARRGGLLYYRLRQLDTDGTATYSPVRTVHFAGSEGPAFAAWPNPAHDAYTVHLRAARAQTTLVTVHDALGRLVSQLPVQVQAGDNQLPASFGLTQPSGMYLLSAELDGQVLRTRLVRE
ncbi:T9SS type A sorting domain-containing protein [Hymenobacter sp. HMF4947]|uniref:T9SS type A sorting domain-containing protein n=1 Tax=Hymenobacter ginkgonis TaxID=2682976 RepID=A0A7K1TBA7_9BACT|nr:T9SS type A sorting domain-containing protein [Hymenobacter ginkgonis]MVN75663.1 T9SS type A sorting domain-containing protein [Hymenobacter ginkgonis]